MKHLLKSLLTYSTEECNMKAIHFGAGNIGRGFIGLLLSQAGYSITFVDVNQELIGHLNECKQYTVQYANASKDSYTVDHVDGIVGSDMKQVSQSILIADIVTTAVGVNILKFIAPAIADGIEHREKLNLPPLVVIACENAIRASSILKEEIIALLPSELTIKLDQLVVFPDAAVDRIVPIQHHEEPLFVTVESFYEWTIEKKLWPQHLKLIDGVHYVELLDPYIERKLFTVNTGHATAAYLGQLKGYNTIQEAMQDVELVQEVLLVLQETGAALIAHYGFYPDEHQAYIEQIIERFKNSYLTDEITRVGRSPIRKLSPLDRFIRPALLAQQYGIETNILPKAIAAAFLFHAQDDPEALELSQYIQEHGIEASITKYTGLAANHVLYNKINKQYELLKTQLQA